MDERTRTKILNSLTFEQLEKIVPNINYEIVKEPQLGTVMVKVNDKGRNGSFYIGEVVVYECFVKVNNVVGKGISLNDNPDFSKALAIINGLYKSNSDGEYNLTSKIIELKSIVDDKEKNQAKMILSTKVSFDTMVEE